MVTGGRGVQQKFAFTLNVKFWLYPPRYHGGGVQLKLHKNGKKEQKTITQQYEV